MRLRARWPHLVHKIYVQPGGKLGQKHEEKAVLYKMSWSQPLIFVRDGKNGDVLLPARTSIEAAMVSTMQIDDVRNGNGVCIRMGRARIPVTKGTKPEMDAGFYGPLVAACRIPMVEDIRR